VQKVPGHWRKAGLQKAAQTQSHMAMPHQCSGPCGVHAHAHDRARKSNVPVSDFGGFWGAFGCSCFAF
jgi:hypothetical protein